MNRIVLVAGLVATAVTLGLVYLLVVAPPDRPLEVGDKAPDIRLKGAFGGEGKLSDYRGKVVLLNFWATWCNPCVKEMPSLQVLYSYFEGEDFEIVAVAMDQEGASVVQDFAAAYKLEFALVTDAEKTSEDLYHLTGLPETYLIDKDGVIREKLLGPRDWAVKGSFKLISDLLGHGPKEVASPTATTAETEALRSAAAALGIPVTTETKGK
jgi:peroxiredoxin